MTVRQTGLNISMYKQPAPTSNLNIFNLGFFSTIQSLQQKNPQFNIKNFIMAVDKAYYQMFEDVNIKVSDTLYASFTGQSTVPASVTPSQSAISPSNNWKKHTEPLRLPSCNAWDSTRICPKR